MVKVRKVGLIAYREAVKLQEEIQAAVIDGSGEETLLFVEHPPVITLGRGFHPENLRLPEANYDGLGVAIERSERGGDVTLHSPGQLVVYPIFDIASRGRDLHKWLRDLEQAVILGLAEVDLKGRRFPPHTGVWIGDKKIAAIGVKVSKWVSIHGVAINCDNDLSLFDSIVPCGISNFGVTSASEELGYKMTVSMMTPHILSGFGQVFEGPFLGVANG